MMSKFVQEFKVSVLRLLLGDVIMVPKSLMLRKGPLKRTLYHLLVLCEYSVPGVFF